MARTKVQEYTRQLANGTQVTVAGHQRQYDPSTAEAVGRRSLVDQHRRERIKQQARERRANAAVKGKAAATRGWAGVQTRGRQSWELSKKGGKRLQRAAKLAGRKKRATAACVAVAGVAQIAGALAWSTTGLIATTVSILAATLAGGLFVGKERRSA